MVNFDENELLMESFVSLAILKCGRIANAALQAQSNVSYRIERLSKNMFIK